MQLQRLLLPNVRLNLRLKEREIKLSMMLLLRLKLRPSDLPVLQLKLPIKLKKRLEESVRKSKSQNTRDKWLPEEAPSRRPSETCGLPAIQVYL